MFARLALTLALSINCFAQTSNSGLITEFSIAYADPALIGASAAKC